MRTKQERQTRQIELVETHNLAVSLARLQSSAGGYTSLRWRRALYHAVAMSDCGSDITRKLREALELP